VNDEPRFRDATKLDAEELELLELLLREEGIDSTQGEPSIARAESGNVSPSFAQERVWFLEQLNPGTCTFNVPDARVVRGPLDLRAFEASVAEVARRHDVLRCTFQSRDGRPEIVVHPLRGPFVSIRDLREWPAQARDDEATRLAGELLREPFDLSAGPLWRTMLVRRDTDEHIWLIVMHHLVSDGASLELFVREVAAVYDSVSQGRASELPPLPIQYGDYAAWERKTLVGDALAEHLDYWKAQLDGEAPVLDWPTGKPRPAVQTQRGATLPFELSEELSTAIRVASARHAVSPFMFMLAAYGVLLGRTCGVDDVRISAPSMNRKEPHTRGLIGFFVNTILFRIRLGEARTFRDLLEQVRSTVVGAFEHDDVPFEKLVEALHPARDVSRPVLRQTAFAMQTVLADEIQTNGLTIAPWDVRVDMGTARLDVALFAWEERQRLRGIWEFNTDICDEPLVSRLAETFTRILADLSAPSASEGVLGALLDRAPATEPQRADRSEMTENQRLFWFSRKLQPDVQLYFDHVVAAFTIHGDVVHETLSAAFRRVVESSDALRSVVEEVDGAPRRRVESALGWEFPFVDLSARPDSEGAYAAWLAEARRTPFDPQRCLFATALVKVREGHFVWYLDIHHMVADLWSLRSIVSRVAADCGGDLAGATDDGSLPFGDFVALEREYQGSADFARAESYWRQKLQRELIFSRFYRATASSLSTATARVSFDLGEERSLAIRRVAREQGLFSPATVVKTALCAYLHRATGEALLRVGEPFANRPDGFSGTIGLFINVCPLDVEIDEHETFTSLAAKLQAEMLEVMRYQRYPIRNPANKRVYDVYFNYQNASFPDFAGAPVSFDLLHTHHSNDTLTVQLQDFGGTGSFSLDIDFKCDAFDEKEQHRTTHHIVALLDAFLDRPVAPIDEVDILTEEERIEVFETFNDTTRDYASDAPLHALIEAQCVTTPEAIAVAAQGARLTYRELDRRADLLAHHLRTLGVGRDVVVGVHMERSVELVVSLLAVLKAGGAYLPLEPSYPPERLSYMLEDAHVPVVLTLGRLAEKLPPNSARTIAVDAEWHCLEAAAVVEAGRSSSEPTRPDDLAYVIYTSGSTGRPKGVAIAHRGICNRLLWMQETYRLTADDRVLQKTPFSFDVSVWEFFWPLMTGACLVMARPGGHTDAEYLVEIIRGEAVTTIHFVPSMLDAFLEHPRAETCDTLKRVVCSGEALPHALVGRFLSRMTAELHNLYGPTEASVDVTAWKCERGARRGVIPIGHPIANTRIYILDENRRPVPPGLVGEIYLAGVGLARGYVNNAVLTGERFVEHTLSNDRRERLYRTSDLGRYLADGSIEFLGRADHQVKLRGFRIELGEIEAVLTRHPAVREAVVILREDRPNDRRLVAYVVGETSSSFDPSQLGAFLEKQLPEYMIPATYIPLEVFPLTSNGKVDRRALPVPEWGRRDGGKFEAPRSELEKLLAEIWCDVLGLSLVDRRDSFFDLGGHSLLATQVISRVNRILPVNVPLSLLFESATLESFARKCEEASRAREDDALLSELLATVEAIPEGELSSQRLPPDSVSDLDP
jgi:amino acid adenylation domain-containing protein